MIAATDVAQSTIQNPKSKILNDLLRAAFLASSWTWVIGMFLPVLLVREWGVWAWVIFAVPNCVGAAAMGWTMRTREHSARLVASHDAACRAFSLVTIAFHVFFLAWLILPWMNWRGWALGVLVFSFAFLTMRTSGVGLAAALVYVYSLICAALFLGDAGVNVVQPDALPHAQLTTALLALIPVCVFGFALDPYLDLTFHAARQASDDAHDRRSAKIAFGVGFCVLFFSMIAFTLAYSGVLWRDVRGSVVSGTPPPAESAVWFVAGHILFQAAFTTAIHTAAVTGNSRQCRTALNWLGVAIAAAIGVTAGLWARRAAYAHEMLAGEFVYRLFMASYGLIFPAYVWICIAPTWRSPAPPTRRQFLAFAAAVCAAVPFFWLAFIEHRMPWAVVGVAIAFFARFAGSGRPAAGDAP